MSVNIKTRHLHRSVADLTEAKALATGMQDGVLIQIRSLGLFKYLTTQPEAANDRDVINVTAGGQLQRLTPLRFVTTADGKIDSTMLPYDSPFQYKGTISVAADFPTSAEVQPGWSYIIKADVTDNDPTRTNTGQSFLAGVEIVWDGVDAWDPFGADVLWAVDGDNIKAIIAKHIDLQNKALTDANATSPIYLTTADDPAFSTTKKSIVGAVNEVKGVADGAASAASTAQGTANSALSAAQAAQGDIDGFPDELKNLTQAEIQQLENIGATGISAAQWGYLGGLNQALAKASQVEFAKITIPGGGTLLEIGTETNLGTPAITMVFKNSGFAAPSNVGSTSLGDKWVFWNYAATYKGAIGFDSRTMWFQSTDVGATANRFKWFGGSAGTPVEIFSLGDLETTFNEGRLDSDFKIAKVTSGYAYIYDFGASTHTFVGAVTLPTGSVCATQTYGDNTTKLATTAFVQAAVGGAVTNYWKKTGTLLETVTADDSVKVDVGATLYATTMKMNSNAGLTLQSFAGGAWTNSLFIKDGAPYVGFGLAAVNKNPEAFIHVAGASDSKVILEECADQVVGFEVDFRKSRGAYTAKTAIVTGDSIFRLIAKAYDGSTYFSCGQIEVTSTGTIGTGSVPSNMYLYTSSGSSLSAFLKGTSAWQTVMSEAGYPATNINSTVTSIRTALTGRTRNGSSDHALTLISDANTTLEIMGNPGSTILFSNGISAPSVSLIASDTEFNIQPGTNKRICMANRIGTLPAFASTTIFYLQANYATTDYCRMSIISGATGRGYLNFGDVDSEARGIIRYNHSDDSMYLGVAGAEDTVQLTTNIFSMTVGAKLYRADFNGFGIHMIPTALLSIRSGSTDFHLLSVHQGTIATSATENGYLTVNTYTSGGGTLQGYIKVYPVA